MISFFKRIRKKKKKSDIVIAICPTWDHTQPPVGIAYLKSFLMQKGYNVKCFDFNIDLYKNFKNKGWWNLNTPDFFISEAEFKKIKPIVTPFIQKWAEQVLAENPKIVGLSLFMSTVNSSILLAAELKKRKPGIKIVAGGPDVSRISDKLQKTGFFDYMVNGEGELAFYQLLKDEENYRKKVYTHEFIKNLDVLPFPDYSDFDIPLYKKSYQLPLVTSRGCTGNCTFCADKPLWKIYRYRHAKNIYREIKHLSEKYGVKNFEFVDSTINGNLKELSKLCDLLVENNIRVKWSGKAMLRADIAFKLLQKMKKAGCTSLAYGLESGSQAVLDDMRKNLKLEVVERVIKDTYQAGIDICCFLIIGYPTETDKDFEQTLKFIRKNYKFIKEFGQITGCHIEYNSYLGTHMDEYGIVFKEDGWHSKYSTPKIRKERRRKVKSFLESIYKMEIEVQP